MDGQFCNKTVKECDEDKPKCTNYHYTYKNNTEIFGKGKNTTKTCENLKKNQDFAGCNIWCCQKPQCNRGSTQRRILILEFIVLVLSLELSVMYIYYE
jgi:hypothetical protein